MKVNLLEWYKLGQDESIMEMAMDIVVLTDYLVVENDDKPKVFMCILNVIELDVKAFKTPKLKKFNTDDETVIIVHESLDVILATVLSFSQMNTEFKKETGVILQEYGSYKEAYEASFLMMDGTKLAHPKEEVKDVVSTELEALKSVDFESINGDEKMCDSAQDLFNSFHKQAKESIFGTCFLLVTAKPANCPDHIIPEMRFIVEHDNNKDIYAPGLIKQFNDSGKSTVKIDDVYSVAVFASKEILLRCLNNN